MIRQRTKAHAPTVGRRRSSADPGGREALLDAAIKLFAERGIANTTVAQIAAAGRVTPAMVHYWFDTRGKLQDAIVDERIAPLMRDVWMSADAAQDDVVTLVRGLVSRMLDVTEQAAWLPSLWLREIVQEGGLLRERMLKRVPIDRVAAFRTTVARAQKEGRVHAGVAPELVFLSLLALVMLPQAVARTWQRLNPEATIDRARLERHVLTLLIEGLVVQRSRKPTRSRT